MIQPGMMFGGEGPVMQGTWYNPQTGDAFTVRDSFFEDNQYVVTTTDGRYINYNQLQNYIQSDMKLEDLKRTRTTQEEPIPAEVMSIIEQNDTSNNKNDDYFGIIPEDMDIISGKSDMGNLGNIYAPPTQQKQPTGYTTQPVQNMNTAIIEKALKNATKPNLSIVVEWDNYPSKEIEMLKDIMDIPTTEIVDWYLDNIQLDEFIMAFKVAIDDKISFGNDYKQAEIKMIKLDEPTEAPMHEDKVEDTMEQSKQKTEKSTRARGKDKKDKKTTKK